VAARAPRQIPGGQVFTQPRPAGPSAGRRDPVSYYQYRHDRARRALRGIGEQVAKAEKAVAGKMPVKCYLWVPKTRATWPDALLAAGHSAPRQAHVSPVWACRGVGVIFGLWA